MLMQIVARCPEAKGEHIARTYFTELAPFRSGCQAATSEKLSKTAPKTYKLLRVIPASIHHINCRRDTSKFTLDKLQWVTPAELNYINCKGNPSKFTQSKLQDVIQILHYW